MCTVLRSRCVEFIVHILHYKVHSAMICRWGSVRTRHRNTFILFAGLLRDKHVFFLQRLRQPVALGCGDRYGYEALLDNEFHGIEGFYFTPYSQKVPSLTLQTNSAASTSRPALKKAQSLVLQATCIKLSTCNGFLLPLISSCAVPVYGYFSPYQCQLERSDHAATYAYTIANCLLSSLRKKRSSFDATPLT